MSDPTKTSIKALVETQTLEQMRTFNLKFGPQHSSVRGILGLILELVEKIVSGDVSHIGLWPCVTFMSNSYLTQKTQSQVIATVQAQKHSFHILGSSPFPLLVGVFTLL